MKYSSKSSVFLFSKRKDLAATCPITIVKTTSVPNFFMNLPSNVAEELFNTHSIYISYIFIYVIYSSFSFS